jgi:hypothetical protein
MSTESGQPDRRGTNRVPHTKAPLLPGRPHLGDASAGPAISPEDPTQPKVSTRAICCSGGGIRSAAFSLGGLQYLNQPDGGGDGDGDGGSIYQRTDFVTSVSGGGYIAGSFALVQRSVQPTDPITVYSPGSPEDNRLRAHTRYLVDSRTQLAFSMMGILYGLLLNLLAVLAVVLMLATALGYALGEQGLRVLTRDGTKWQSHYPSALSYTLLGLAALGVTVYVAYRFWDARWPLSEAATKRCCGTALALLCGAGLGSGLFLGVPWILVELSSVPSRVHRAGAGVQTGTLVGTAVALAGIVKQVLGSYEQLSKNELVSAATGTQDKKNPVANLRTRLAAAVLPWLGSTLIVLILLVCLLTWVSNMATHGQNHNLQIVLALGALGLLYVWQRFLDCNDTSLHRYYAQRLATAFAVRRDGREDRTEEVFSGYGDDKPALVICAAVNTDQPGGTPSGRNCAPFTFSPHFCGISSGTMFGDEKETAFNLAAREESGQARQAWSASWRGSGQPSSGLFISTKVFEARAPGLLLRDLMAVSAAAISPAMGRMSKPSLRLVLGTANVRLGMWLPNPLRVNSGLRASLRSWFRRPGLLELSREMLGGMTLHTPWVYVTDGGHYENLGLVEALRRGATEIFVLDASGDKPFSLSTFGEAVETARADLGVDIRFGADDPDPLGVQREVTVANRSVAKSLAAVATATYANGVVATIYLCKAALVTGLPPDIVTWAAANDKFPNDSTGNQLYGDREFEAYRQLGWEAAKQACELRAGGSVAAVTVAPPVSLVTSPAVTVTSPVVTVTSPVVTVTSPVVTVTPTAVPQPFDIEAVSPAYADPALAPRVSYERFMNALIVIVIRALRRPNASRIPRAGQASGRIRGPEGTFELGDTTPPTGSN